MMRKLKGRNSEELHVKEAHQVKQNAQKNWKFLSHSFQYIKNVLDYFGNFYLPWLHKICISYKPILTRVLMTYVQVAEFAV